MFRCRCLGEVGERVVLVVLDSYPACLAFSFPPEPVTSKAGTCHLPVTSKHAFHPMFTGHLSPCHSCHPLPPPETGNRQLTNPEAIRSYPKLSEVAKHHVTHALSCRLNPLFAVAHFFRLLLQSLEPSIDRIQPPRDFILAGILVLHIDQRRN